MQRALKIILTTLFTLLSITLFTFILVWLAPSDAAEQLLLGTGLLPSDATVEALRHDLGLDRSLPVQYISWLVSLLHGDMGTSYSTGVAVWDSLAPATLRTLTLGFWAFLITVIVSLPLGILCAMYRGKTLDKVIRIVTYVLAAIPSFVVGLALLYFLSEKNNILPSIANNHIGGLIMPVTVLSLSSIVWMVRQIRTIMIEKMGEPYLVGLRARGIEEYYIVLFYVLKNSMVPIVTSYGICFGSMLGGAAIVEQIFTWSGLGRVVLHAISMRDYPIILGFAIWIALIYCVINAVVDLLYGVFDPRIRKGQAEHTLSKRRKKRLLSKACEASTATADSNFKNMQKCKEVEKLHE